MGREHYMSELEMYRQDEIDAENERRRKSEKKRLARKLGISEEQLMELKRFFRDS